MNAPLVLRRDLLRTCAFYDVDDKYVQSVQEAYSTNDWETIEPALIRAIDALLANDKYKPEQHEAARHPAEDADMSDESDDHNDKIW